MFVAVAFTRADGYTIDNTDYFVTVDPMKCNCNPGDPTQHTVTIQRILSVRFSGECAGNGWCDVEFTFNSPDPIEKTVAIPAGRCLVGVRISLVGAPEFQKCSGPGECPSGNFDVTTHAPTAITVNCPTAEPQGVEDRDRFAARDCLGTKHPRF